MVDDPSIPVGYVTSITSGALVTSNFSLPKYKAGDMLRLVKDDDLFYPSHITRHYLVQSVTHHKLYPEAAYYSLLCLETGIVHDMLYIDIDNDNHIIPLD